MERKVVIFDHPLIQHKLSILRDANTSTKDFRELVNEIAMLMTYEATRDLPTEDIKVKTASILPAEKWRSFRFFVQVSVWLTAVLNLFLPLV
mgnify:CR=1 FL=1